MKPLAFAAASLTLLALSGCVAPDRPVQVTRFHLPDTSRLGRGTIYVAAAPGSDPQSFEFRPYAAAVANELTRLGYSNQAPGTATDQVALVRLQRAAFRPDRRRGPVSVGVGGSTGGWGSGVGVGLGIDLSGPPPAQVDTELFVTIRNRASDMVLWEGRAEATVRSNSPLARTQTSAARMARALFRDFPGRSGETIEVR